MGSVDSSLPLLGLLHISMGEGRRRKRHESYQADNIIIGIVSRYNLQYHIAKNRSELALIVLMEM